MPRSLTVRISRAGFGFLAIWCLGCTSFDALIDGLLAGRLAAGETCLMPDEARPSPANGTPVVQASTDASRLQGCGCSHCVGVQSDATTIAVAPHATPDTLVYVPGSALSVAREPLVPPPIGATA